MGASATGWLGQSRPGPPPLHRNIGPGGYSSSCTSHANWYLALAEEAAPRSTVRAWPERLLIEHDNLRAAIRWLIECNAVDQAVRLGGLLHTVWVFGGFLTEGRAQLRALLALPGASRASADWAQLVWSAGFDEFYSGDNAAARARMEQAVEVRRTIGDPSSPIRSASSGRRPVNRGTTPRPVRGWKRAWYSLESRMIRIASRSRSTAC